MLILSELCQDGQADLKLRCGLEADAAKAVAAIKAAQKYRVSLAAATARRQYTAQWSELLARRPLGTGIALPAACIRFKDMPWPSKAWLDAALVHPRRRGWTTSLDPAEVQSVVVPPEVSSTAARSALKFELRRWHPDQFEPQYDRALLPAERDEILEGVKAVTQCLTELLQSDSSA